MSRCLVVGAVLLSDRVDGGVGAPALALTAAQIRWPGVDRDRARGAAWHLERSLASLCQVLLLERAATEEMLHPREQRWMLKPAQEHARIARGYLGAIGFEQRGRL